MLAEASCTSDMTSMTDNDAAVIYNIIFICAKGGGGIASTVG
jgi:hypothetical protein